MVEFGLPSTFPKSKEILLEHVTSCRTCKRLNYRNLSSAIKLIPIKITYKLKSLELSLIGLYIYKPDRYIYVLVFANTFLYNFVSKYRAPTKCVIGHGHRILADIFKVLCATLVAKNS